MLLIINNLLHIYHYLNQQLSEVDANYLKGKYKKIFDAAAAAKQEEGSLTRRLKLVQNEILSEQIAAEKSKIEEIEETSKLAKASEARSLLQKDYEISEQKDTMAKYELFELHRVHEELKNTLSTNREKNSHMVDPVLSALRQEVRHDIVLKYLSSNSFLFSF